MNDTHIKLQRYIDDMWEELIRYAPSDTATLIGLPHRYLVPRPHNGLFQEMYYWDSYFMALGIVDTQHQDVVIEITENMLYLIDRFGVIPNANRFYFLSRSQPPVLTHLIWLAYNLKKRRGDDDAREFLRRATATVQREHQHVWLGNAAPHERRVHRGLSRYHDANYLDDLAACESGWDHSIRCQSSASRIATTLLAASTPEYRWNDHLPVDLNSLLYQRERHFAAAAVELDESPTQWLQAAEERGETIRELMWDQAAGFFFDYDYIAGERNPALTLAGFYPLWARIATDQQAERIVTSWLPRFSRPGGLVTSLRGAPGRQWGHPNGWAPLQWIVATGLDNYGYHDEANAVRRAWCRTIRSVFDRTGTVYEKYNVARVGERPEGGLYGEDVAGFGWTNASYQVFTAELDGHVFPHAPH